VIRPGLSGWLWTPVGSDTAAVSVVSYVTDNNPDLK
jgi:hypothetical protein